MVVHMVSSSRLAQLVAVALVAVFVAVTLFGQSLSLARPTQDLLDRSTDGVGKTLHSSASWTAKGCSTTINNAHPPQKNTTGGPTFLFVVGLEGTGHHLFATLFAHSVHSQRLTEQIRTDLGVAATLLYGDGGLMTLHCLDRLNPKRNVPNLRNVLVRRDSPVATCPRSDSVCLHNKVVVTLRSVSSTVGNNVPLVIPLNANQNGPTMASYPNNMNQCRSLEYPRLDLFYDVCRDANVHCGHVYLYRTPFDVIKSTTQKRHYNPGPASAMQLYTTMLDVIYAQFTKYASTNYGCFGFYDQDLNPHEKWSALGELLGWTNHTEFSDYVRSVYRAPLPPRNGTVVVPPRQARWLNALNRAHRDVLELCRRQTAGQM